MSESKEREFWQQINALIEEMAQVIYEHKLEKPPPGTLVRTFDPSDSEPKQERAFWQTIRRNLLGASAAIKGSKIGGSSTVKLKPGRRRYREQKLDKPPGKRT